MAEVVSFQRSAFSGQLSAVSLAMLILATWRISALLVSEAGPFDVFFRLRKITGIKHDDQKQVWIIPKRFWPELFSCVWCMSVWVGAGWTAAWWLTPTWVGWAALPFALSAGGILIECAVDALKYRREK